MESESVIAYTGAFQPHRTVSPTLELARVHAHTDCVPLPRMPNPAHSYSTVIPTDTGSAKPTDTGSAKPV